MSSGLSRGTRMFLGVLIGVVVPTLAVTVASRTPEKPQWTQVVLSPGQWVAGLAGPMPVVGQGASGRPIEKPMPKHVAFGMAGILFTVVVYGLLSFLLLSLVRSVKPRTTA